MKDVTRQFARYVCASQFDRLPQAVRHEGARAFVNYVGCAAGGSQEPDVKLMTEMLAEFNGAKEATIIGRPERLDVLNTTFINSMSSAALAFNDTHFTSVAHPTSPVGAALLALAERHPLSGRDLLHALILGVEVQCRVGNILTVPPAECAVGLSMQGLVGSIGAAVGAAKALGLDETATAVAIGLAANQSAGIREAQSTMASHLTPGHAARCGLLSAFLAARGFECSDTMIEGVKGFGVSFSSNPNYAAGVDKLGEVFEIVTLAYKPYPSGFVIHPVIDACLEIVQQPGFDAAQIERVDLTVNPLAGKLTDIVTPKDRGQALVSLQHWTAAALMFKAGGIAEVSDEVVRDPAVAAMRHKVSFTGDDKLGREAAKVRVTLKGGKVLEAAVESCRGSIKRPLSDEDITTKTRAQLQMVYPAAATERILDASWRIAECPKMADYCKLLVS